MYLITGWRKSGLDPGEIGLSSVEVVLKGVNECGEKRPGLKPAGLSDGQDSLDPAVALFTGGTLGALSPQDAEAQDSFRVIVGGGHAFFFQKEPQAGKLSFQMPGKSTGGILAIAVEGDQSDEAGIESPPLPRGLGAPRPVPTGFGKTSERVKTDVNA